MIWILLALAIIEGGIIFYLYRIISSRVIGDAWVDGKTYKPEIMTGKDIEEVRIIATSDAAMIGNDIILDLIYTLRQSVLGLYHDDDAYVPPNPYDEVENQIKK